MAIYLTLTAAAGNAVQESNIGASLTKSLTVSAINDTDGGALNISDFNYSWYFVDKPQGSSASIDESSSPANRSAVILNSIDTWGTYRIFVVATNSTSPGVKSEENPLKADERNFLNISVQSTNNNLEKPAAFQRNWKSKYDTLVDVVDNTTKKINTLTVSNSLSFTLPTSDGTAGQVIKTDGSGNLSFVDVSLAETDLNIGQLTDVSSTQPQPGQVLSWSGTEWQPSEQSSEGIDLTSLSVVTTPPVSGSGSTGSLSYDNQTGVFSYSPTDVISIQGLSSSNNILTVDQNYSFLPSTNSTVDIGSDSLSFRSLWIDDGDDEFNGGIFCDGVIQTNSILIGADNLTNSYSLPNEAGSSHLNKFLKLTTNNNVNFANISHADLPSITVTTNSPSGTGSLTYNSTNGSFNYTPPLVTGGGGAADNIYEGDAKVEAVDTGTDGRIDFYTQKSTDSTVFTSTPSPVWKIDEDGNLKPGANGAFNLGHYDAMGSSSDNRQIKEIHVDKIFSNGNYFRIPPAMSSSDFILNAVHDSMSATYNIPFYNNTATPSNSAASGHIIVKDLSVSYGPHDWSPWAIKLPSSFNYNSNSVMVTNNDVDEFIWEKTDLYKIKEWSNSYDNEWTDTTTYASGYSASLGKSRYIFAFKNITGKTIEISKASLSCLEMYSDKIKWTLVGATDAEFKQNVGTSLTAEQTISITNQLTVSPNSGLGQSEVTLSQTIANGRWVAFLITSISSSSNSNKRFVANITYELS